MWNCVPYELFALYICVGFHACTHEKPVTDRAMFDGQSQSLPDVTHAPQVASGAWRAQVGHNEAGLQRKFYGCYRRTAHAAALDADK